MGRPKINDRRLLQLIDREGKSQSAAARILGVSRQAVSKRLKELRGHTTRAVVAKKVGEVIEHKIDAIAQLNRINEHANEILEYLMQVTRGSAGAIDGLGSAPALEDASDPDIEMPPCEFKSRDPRELALRTMAEIRNQLKLQLEMFQTLYSLQAAEEFQQIVLETIAEVSPDVRAEIIRRLNNKRAVRAALRLA